MIVILKPHRGEDVPEEYITDAAAVWNDEHHIYIARDGGVEYVGADTWRVRVVPG